MFGMVKNTLSKVAHCGSLGVDHEFAWPESLFSGYQPRQSAKGNEVNGLHAYQ